MNITALIPLSFWQFFSLKFHFVYPFIAALCRLQLELGKALCSIAVIIIIIIIIIIITRVTLKSFQLNKKISESQLFDFKLFSNRWTFSILDDWNESRTGQVLKQNLVSVWDDFILAKKLNQLFNRKVGQKIALLGHFVNLQFRQLAILTTQSKIVLYEN